MPWCLWQYERIYNFPQEAFDVRVDQGEEDSDTEEVDVEEKEEEVETDEDVEGQLEKEVLEEERGEQVCEDCFSCLYHICHLIQSKQGCVVNYVIYVFGRYYNLKRKNCDMNRCTYQVLVAW